LVTIGVTVGLFTTSTATLAGTIATQNLWLTDIAGSVIGGANCAVATGNGTCATLFGAANAAGIEPGQADVTNTATITYKGSKSPTSSFRLYATGYATKAAGSGAACTAVDPALAVDLQIAIGATVIYPISGVGYGTLAGFATTYTTSANGLGLKGGTGGVGAVNQWATNDSSVFSIKVHVDAAASTNTYQGCNSGVDLVWYAD
jgi:hypothetical protein